MAPYNTPQAIRPLEKTICDFAYSNGYDPISVFNDFLRYVIHGFSPGAPPLMDWKYKRQQNRHFMEMLTGWIRLMQRELQSGGWFDAFGDLFMAISSKIGRQVNGQFFTPPDICDLMVLCTDSGETATGKRICDPTCGSGRLLLAYHVRHLGNYLVAEINRMIMKLNVSNELKSRLMHAAENGSVIAKDILLEVKKNVPVEEIIRGTYNCFSTKRKRTEAGTFKKIRIVFTACSKDLAHPSFPDRNNPQAPWFPENRTVLEPSTFVELFKNLPKYSPDEINYFCSALSLDSKVTVRLHESMNDFMEAYLESNYSPIADSDTSSLHSSCMRYEDKARNAADFYTNFAGAKILVARDESNNILGRAVVWNEVTLWKSINTPIAASLLDRIYFSHAFVAELIRKQAQEAGILLRRRYNDYTHTTDFTVLNPIEGQEWIWHSARIVKICSIYPPYSEKY